MQDSLRFRLLRLSVGPILMFGIILYFVVSWLISSNLENEFKERLITSKDFLNQTIEKFVSYEQNRLIILGRNFNLNMLVNYDVKKVGEEYTPFKIEEDGTILVRYTGIKKKYEYLFAVNHWKKVIFGDGGSLDSSLEIFDRNGKKIGSSPGDGRIKKTLSGDIRISEVLNLDEAIKQKKVIRDYEINKGLAYIKVFVPFPWNTTNPDGVLVVGRPFNKNTLNIVRNSVDIDILVLDDEFNVIEKTLPIDKEVEIATYKDILLRNEIVEIKSGNVKYMVTLLPIHGFGKGKQGYFALLLDKSSIASLENRVNLLIGFIAISIGIILSIVSYRFAGKITDPVSEILLKMKKVEKGEYETLEMEKLPGEIDQIKNSYNSMIIKIQENMKTLNNRDKELITKNIELEKIISEKEEMYRKSITDGLTGMYNHIHFKKRLENELKRIRRYPEKLSLILLDIDFFKRINDKLGHQKGDEALENISSWIKESVRGSDFAARYGGEEFGIILTNTDKEGAFVFAERLRNKIMEESMKTLPEMTVSMGISEISEDIFNKDISISEIQEDFIEKADKALYNSKHKGRNMTTIYSEELDSCIL